MVRARTDVDELEHRLRYRFLDRDLLQRALTHSTAKEGQPVDDNRRLAFLGDAVIELTVRETSYRDRKLPTRGALSSHADLVVPDRNLAAIAEKLELVNWLDISEGTLVDSKARQTVMAEALEALAGALYLDGKQHSFLVLRRLVNEGPAPSST